MVKDNFIGIKLNWWTGGVIFKRPHLKRATLPLGHGVWFLWLKFGIIFHWAFEKTPIDFTVARHELRKNERNLRKRERRLRREQ